MDAVEQERLRQGIAALRSGEFQQAQGALRLKQSPDRMLGEPEYRYCCLGVLTEVAVRNGLQLEAGLCACGSKFDEEHDEELAELDPDLAREDVCQEVTDVWEFSTGVLSKPVMAWYGITIEDPRIGILNEPPLPASAANDDHGWSFEQIADAFEATYITAPGTESDARTIV